MQDKIFQIKYNHDNYAYYKAKQREDITENTNFYRSYTDCTDEKNNLNLYEQQRIYTSLKKFYEQVK